MRRRRDLGGGFRSSLVDVCTMNHVVPIYARAARPGTRDPDELQLPMPGLYADLELGAASMHLPDDFHNQPALVQLKLLAEWQRALARYRHGALQQFALELTRGAGGMGEAERLALLRTTCESLRIELPAGCGSPPAHA